MAMLMHCRSVPLVTADRSSAAHLRPKQLAATRPRSVYDVIDEPQRMYCIVWNVLDS